MKHSQKSRKLHVMYDFKPPGNEVGYRMQPFHLVIVSVIVASLRGGSKQILTVCAFVTTVLHVLFHATTNF
jgi:hypothetical protein